MFARTFRAAQPLKRSVRRYATEAGGAGGSNAIMFAGGAAVLGGAAYWYFSGASSPAAAAADVKQAVGAEPKKAFTGGDQGFLSLKLAEVEIVNHNTKRLRFELPEPDQVSGLPVASALLTKVRGFIDFVVKKYPNGPMSTHIHNLVPGQRLDIKGPLPKYQWEENKHTHIALIAGGTGITPMYQLTRAIFNNPNDKTKVTLVFGNVTEEDILLKKQFDELENTYPQRFRAFYVLDNPPKEWVGNKGYISKELLKTVLPEPKEENIKLFVCGPPGLMKAISGNKVSPKDQGELTGSLKELGYSQEQVYKF
ncbi:hypothetical protein LRP88_08719 [Fusarium phalaenopsidis]